ncbi:alpha/beta fold hydrolase, partial [Nostoc sp. NIES-2111]
MAVAKMLSSKDGANRGAHPAASDAGGRGQAMATADNGFHFDGGPVAVLLVHGLTGTPVEMRGLGKSLARSGFTVRGVQLAGHCGTEADLVATGWRDWHASVMDALDDLRRRHRQVFVGGLSLGALLALTAAAERPRDVAGVLLYS